MKINSFPQLLSRIYLLILLISTLTFLKFLPIAVTAETPQAAFKFTPRLPYVNETIVFDASTSKPGDGSITLYSWNFGDNTTGTGVYVEKSYETSANYTVTLIVINSIGMSDYVSEQITVLPQPDGLTIDVFNQKGGYGRNQPSGDFAPGEIVELTALVTFQNEPAEYKPVSFEVRDAMDEVILYRSALTDENGMATINFTVYGECLPSIFGTWTVIVLTEVSGQKASDTLTFKVSGPYLDIFTQHPDPYSGRGPNEQSDAFAPQQEVILYGEAHYDCEPIEYKFVAFEVRDPNGEEVTYRTSPTNESGIAVTSFRLESNATFGIYTVFAIVEILGRNACDTLTFRVGWIIEILNVSTTSPSGVAKSIFAKGEHICFNVTAKNIAFTSKMVTFTIATCDAENAPIGHIILQNWAASPGDSTIFLILIEIPKWAFTGLSTVYANAYTDLPTLGGVPYGPEASAIFTII
jgi:PKD repeat protein